MPRLALVLLLLTSACVSGEQVDGAVVPVPTVRPDALEVQEGTLARPDVVTLDCDRPDPATVPEGVDPLEGVRCGVVVLPEDREDPSGPVVEVAFTWVQARPPPGEAASDVPLVVLADGPGDPMTAELSHWLGSTIRAERDVILLDSRGAGRSFPSLDCGQPPSPGDLPLDLVEDCRRDLAASGVQVEEYTSAVIAADVVDVTAALDLTGYALLGVGHGARIALEVLRRAPFQLEALVLDSPEPPEVDVLGLGPATAQAAVNRLFDECAQTPACDRAVGDLRGEVATLVRQMDVAATDADVGATSGDDLVRAALAAMRGAEGPAVVPAALAEAVAGDLEEALERLRSAAIAGQTVPSTTFSEGLRLSVQCHDRVPFATTAEAEDAMDAIGRAVAADVRALRDACAIWDVGSAPQALTEPVTGAVPTLVMTGEFDPYSTAAWAGAVAARLETAQVVQVDGAGHRVHDADNCTTAIVAEFLRRPRRSINDDCARDRVVDFAVPGR